MDFGHWIYPGEFDETEWFGFIYKIVNKISNKQYIGKKQFQSTRRKVVKNRQNRKIIRKDSGWRTYLSSSEYVKTDIINLGKENFDFLILSLHKTKGALSYAEIERQITEDVLRATLPDGQRTYYNKSIGNIKFLPPDETSDETKHKISQTLINFWLNNNENHYFNKMSLEEQESWR